MSTRKIKTYSDRGKISDIQSGIPEIGDPATPFEIRLAKLHEADKNSVFITTEYISDKNALPLSIYRLRKTVADIKSKSGSDIDKLADEISNNFSDETPEIVKSCVRMYLNKSRVKTASLKKPTFWRASKT